MGPMYIGARGPFKGYVVQFLRRHDDERAFYKILVSPYRSSTTVGLDITLLDENIENNFAPFTPETEADDFSIVSNNLEGT